MHAPLAEVRLQVANDSISQQPFVGFSGFDGAFFVMIFLIVFLCTLLVMYSYD